MDTVSQLVRAVRLAGADFFKARFTAPWSCALPHADAVAPRLAPEAGCGAVFYLITDGDCYLELQDRKPLHLIAGDVVVLPKGDAHRLSSRPGLTPIRNMSVADMLTQWPRQLDHGGGGAETRLVGGYLACDSRASCSCNAMPEVVRVNVRDSDAGLWLEASIGYALSEADLRRPGGSSVLAKLAEVMLIEVLRLYAKEHGDGRSRLAGVGDRIVGAALKALHERPAHAWTLEELARVAATSRSVLAERFQQLVGNSPMQYLAQRRMHLAASLLSDGNTSLARVAEKVGYQTDTAFNRAFRREFGLPPATWRRVRAKRGQAHWQLLTFDWNDASADSAAHVLAAVRTAVANVGLLDYITAAFPVEICSILLLNAAGTHFEVEAYSGSMALSLPGDDWPITVGAAGRAVREGKPQLLADVRADPDYVAGNEKVRSEYIVPIRCGERVVGCLNLESARRDCFTDDNQDMFRNLADRMAGALKLPGLNRLSVC